MLCFSELWEKKWLRFEFPSSICRKGRKYAEDSSLFSPVSHLEDSPSHLKPFSGLAKDGCLEVLIENLSCVFQFRPIDESLHFKAQFKMNNLL